MELRPLRSFIAAAEDGNISRAATRLHLTQPALSRQIKGLEDELGVTLLERGAHSFTLTPAGELLLREGRGLLERADALEQRVRATAKAQTIRVGYSPSLTASILSPAMEAFTQVHPKARVDLFDMTTHEMVDGLQKGTLDIAITVPTLKEIPDITWITVQSQSWRVAVSRQHPLVAKKTLVPQDLNEQRLVVYSQKDYPDYWTFISTWFRQQRINARIASECDGITSLISAVDAGVGIALVVEHTACLIPERVVLKPLNPQPEPLPISVGMLERQKNDKVLAVFVEELKRAGTLDISRRVMAQG